MPFSSLIYLHGSSETWFGPHSSSLASLQRVDQRGLASVGISNYAHRDALFQTLRTTIILQQLQQVVSSQTSPSCQRIIPSQTVKNTIIQNHHHSRVEISFPSSEIALLHLRVAAKCDRRKLLTQVLQPCSHHLTRNQVNLVQHEHDFLVPFRKDRLFNRASATSNRIASIQNLPSFHLLRKTKLTTNSLYFPTSKITSDSSTTFLNSRKNALRELSRSF
jgi:hypothetical protein